MSLHHQPLHSILHLHHILKLRVSTFAPHVPSPKQRRQTNDEQNLNKSRNSIKLPENHHVNLCNFLRLASPLHSIAEWQMREKFSKI